MMQLAFRIENCRDGIASTFPDNDDNLALAVLVPGEAAVYSSYFLISRFDVPAEIAPIHLSLFAFAADNAALHFLSHRFAELVQEDECGLVGQAQIAAESQGAL